LQNQNWNEDECTYATVVDQYGNELPTQTAKPSCTFNLDWTKKVSFKATAAPSSVTRFDCKLTVKKKADVIKPTYDDEQITVKNDRMRVCINRKTGLIDAYEVDGVSLLRESGILDVYRDNEDPWKMKIEAFDEYEGVFGLMSDDEANEFVGYSDEKTPSVRVVEDGDVYIQIQAFFAYKTSTAVVEYMIPKNGIYVDVNILMYSNLPNKLIKYSINTTFEGDTVGEAPFGCDNMFSDGRESVFQKWCGIKTENKRLYVLNKGTYGGSFDKSSIKLSLLRTPIYSAHPIKKRQIAPHDRFVKHIDMGERQFSFRIIATDDVCTQAQIYNESPRVLSFFPSGDGEPKGSAVEISDPSVLLTSMRTDGDKYVMHLYNSSDNEKDVRISLNLINKSFDVTLGAHEVKIICV
jgi:alpha-mannosidase